MQTTRKRIVKVYFGTPIEPLSEIREIVAQIHYPIYFLYTGSSSGDNYPHHIYMLESANSEPRYIYGDTLAQFFADIKPAKTVIRIGVDYIFWYCQNPQYRDRFREVTAKRVKMQFPFKVLQSTIEERQTWRNDNHLWTYIAEKHAPTDHATRIYLLFQKWQYMNNYCKSAK